MKFLLYEDKDESILNSKLGIAAIAAGIALAAKKIYDYKTKDKRVLEKYGAEPTDEQKIADDTMMSSRGDVLDIGKDFVLDPEKREQVLKPNK